MKLFGKQKPPESDRPSGCYVYVYEIDGTDRYVGKGSGARAWDHLYDARSANRRRSQGVAVQPKHFRDRLGNALRRRMTVRIKIIADSLNDEDALALEVQTILAYAPGQLWNIAEGGLGLTGELARSVNACPIKRAKASASLREKYKDPSRLRQQREILERSRNDPATAMRHAEAVKRAWTPERRAKHAAKIAAYWATAPDERRARQAEVGSRTMATNGRQYRRTQA